MISTPEISVILPVFNAEDTILASVNSILNQTYTSFELIILNDGSTDDTLNLLRGIDDNRIRLFNLTHCGIARALNFGIKMSLGKFIARMDADDYSYPERLARQVEYLKCHKDVGLVSCMVEYDGNRDQNGGYALYVDWMNSVVAFPDILNKRFQESPFAHPSVMFHKSLVSRFGGYSEGKLPEDYELWLRWMNCGVKMAKLSEVLLGWSDLPDRLSRTNANYDESKFHQLKARYLLLHFRRTHGINNLPAIWIWGTGKSVKSRTAPLTELNINISQFIEVKPPPYQNPLLIHYKELPPPGKHIILSYVSDRRGKKEIQLFLNESGYTEGVNYFLMA